MLYLFGGILLRQLTHPSTQMGIPFGKTFGTTFGITFGLARFSNYDRELYPIKSDHLRLFLEILDSLGPIWTTQIISYRAQY